MPNSSFKAERDHDRISCSAPDCSVPTFPGAPWPICPTHLREVYEFVQPIAAARMQLHADETMPVPEANEAGYVYFVQAGDRIKIGWTRWPAGRVKQLQPDAVLAIIEGSRRDEALAHALFAEHRIEGEWFRPAEQLLEFIGQLPRTS